MLEKVIDRLEGMNKDVLNDELLNLVLAAEEMGLECKNYLYDNGTKDRLLSRYNAWQASIDKFYERYVK